MARSVAIYNYLPLEYGGGGEVSCTSIANGLGDMGYAVSYVSDRAYRGPQRVDSDRVRSTIRSFAYRRERFTRTTPEIFGRPLPALKQLQDATANLLVVNRWPNPLFLKSAANRSIPLAILLHGIALDAPWGLPPAAALHQIYSRQATQIASALGRRCGFEIQCFNDVSRTELIALGFSSARLHVIPSGVPFDQFSVSDGGDRFNIVFLGRLEAISKGIALLVEILGRLPRAIPDDISVTVVGSGPASGLIASGSRMPYVSRLGFVTDEVKRSILSRADLMLITSYLEPFSLSAAEALACGVPILTTPASGPSGIVRTSRAFGEVCGWRAEQFVEQIQRFYSAWKESRTRYLQDRRERRRLAREYFDVTRMVAGYRRLVDEML